MSSLLRHPAGQFSSLEDDLADRLAEQLAYTAGHFPSPSERRAWQRSIPVLIADLLAAGLDGVEVLYEYRLPLSSKRADVVLAGVSRATGRAAYLVVELKQWTTAERFEGDEHLVLVPGYGRPVSHPLDQVRGYCEYLDFTTALADDPDCLAGAAYLHNATDLGVSDLLGAPQSPTARLFTGQRRGEFQAFLQQYFAPESGAQAADMLLGSRVALSRQLMAVAADEVQRREMFVLLDEQRDAYQLVLHAVAEARRGTSKTAVIVAGGPGSGKSVVALSLMGELARQGRSVVHATGSQSFTQTLRRVAAKGRPGSGRCSATSTRSSRPSPTTWRCSSSTRPTGSERRRPTASPAAHCAPGDRRSMNCSVQQGRRSSCSTNIRWCGLASSAPLRRSVRPRGTEACRWSRST